MEGFDIKKQIELHEKAAGQLELLAFAEKMAIEAEHDAMRFRMSWMYDLTVKTEKKAQTHRMAMARIALWYKSTVDQINSNI